MNPHQRLDQALRELEATLKAADLWRVEQPSAKALASQQPFCVDSMELPQWLRYVFVARLDALVEAQAPLPSSCSVAPAAEVYLRQVGVPAHHLLLVVKAIERVDLVVTEN
ncbi:YqcC family protein [Franzmannia qiaohouensis]|uniref:YqcC family protein n=1 Tax=Franzmannia qiaohouensis TaxID=1329370 RepID=A0ABU1H9S6_9GAMM|nr:YqcC family protein [Halomonas qiaohouensis]MDR5904210.1 YqcC family protein [Halomonas qiaohouensis]